MDKYRFSSQLKIRAIHILTAPRTSLSCLDSEKVYNELAAKALI